MTKGHVAPRDILCPGCSTIFVSTIPRAKYCSRKCLDKVRWDEKHRKEVRCKTCGETSIVNYSREFCSRKCSDRAWRIKHLYGLSIDDFRNMLDAQDNRCAICKQESDNWSIDHDHSCCPGGPKAKACGNCIRGILCNNCNNGLGRFKDNTNYLKSAVDYLESFIV